VTALEERAVPRPHSAPINTEPASGGTRVDVVLYGDVAMALVAPDLEPLRAQLSAARAVPSFVAGSWLVVATVDRGEGAVVVGCARAEPTPIPVPDGRVPSDLDANEWLAGGLEVVEVVVDAKARGYGVGSMLLGVLPALARDHRAWLVLDGAARAALPFLVRRGWTPLGQHADPIVLMAPAHPGRRSLSSPRRDGQDAAKP
jgi:GNAT superfamily N-acetyltransferase